MQCILSTHPEATLQDIYKSCFQDRFGVAHALGSAEQVANYIAYECTKAERFENDYIENCGWRGNFVRVNLKAVREGRISVDELAEAFIESAKAVENFELHSWLQEWQQIERAVREINPDLAGFERDSATIATLISSGNYVMHHSRRYNEAYAPHYRIVSREQYNKLKDKLK